MPKLTWTEIEEDAPVAKEQSFETMADLDEWLDSRAVVSTDPRFGTVYEFAPDLPIER